MPIATVVNNIKVEEAFLWLLTFTDYNNNVELRAVNDLVDVTSRGNVYTAFPFALTLPPEDGTKLQSLSLTFTNVGRDLMRLVREYDASQRPQVKLELILASAPDVVEKTIDFLQMGNVNYDALAISFELLPANIFARKTCTGTYNQSEFPGMFWALK